MSEDQRKVASAAGLLAASVLIARLLGVLRDAMLAGQVGSGAEADAYFAAFLIPDILGYLLAAGAAAVAITPPYLKRLEDEGAEAAATFRIGRRRQRRSHRDRPNHRSLDSR